MREIKYYPGDKVTLKSDHFPGNLMKGFKKGDRAVILDAVEAYKNEWEIEVEINKNKSSCSVLGEDLEVYKNTPIQLEQKNHIELGELKAALTQDETYLLYKKIQKIKENNKVSFTFQSKKIKFESVEDIDITIRILQKILKQTHYL